MVFVLSFVNLLIYTVDLTFINVLTFTVDLSFVNVLTFIVDLSVSVDISLLNHLFNL